MGRFGAGAPVERLSGAFQLGQSACKTSRHDLPPTGILRTLSVLAPLLLFGLTAISAKEETGTVIRVVDGDTIQVTLAGKAEKVRLIGVDTPETVDPRKLVEFFGKEASEFTKKLVEGKQVVLRDELGGQDRDKYGRLLRYVYLADGTFVNAEIIRQGYGHAYVVYPFSHMEEFRAYERQARERGIGLWGSADAKAEPGQVRAPTTGACVGSSQSNKYHCSDCVWAQKISPANLITFKSPEEAQSRGYIPCKVCSPPVSSGLGSSAQAESLASPSSGASVEPEEIVYVTRSGTKYHRAGCRHLSKSMIPMPLKEAVQRYAPCSVCRPPVEKK